MFRLFLLSLLIFALSGCGGGVNPSSQKSSSDKFFGYYKIGNPYKIKGRIYNPRIDYDYSEVGIASWYGKQFHGRLTANGAIFDMNIVSAAHRTLPLPSYVLVENLENGRELKILVNDRGPFYNDRIIDLSREAAKQLGILEQGTGRVRVSILATESLTLANRLQRGEKIGSLAELNHDETVSAVPTGTVKIEPLDLPQGENIGENIAEPSPWVASAAEPDLGESAKTNFLTKQLEAGKLLFIQVGAYGKKSNAIKAGKKVENLGKVRFLQTRTSPSLYRVRLGPFTDVPKALYVLDEAKEKGFKGAHIILSKSKIN